jgi:hypothetical protein
VFINLLPIIRKVSTYGLYWYGASKFAFELLLTDFDGSIYVDESSGSYNNAKFLFTYSCIRNARIGQGRNINSYTFYYCKFLETVTIGSTVKWIQNNAFASCTALKKVSFGSTTPPTVGNSNAFANINGNCVFLIPYNGLAAYLSATNYPSPDTYVYYGWNYSTDGETLPTQDATQAYNVTWYATEGDALAETNPITVGNGKAIYCRYTAV